MRVLVFVVLSVLLACTVVTAQAPVMQLSTVCPGRYLMFDQQLWITHLITNVSGDALTGGGYVVETDRYDHRCQDPAESLPPGGQVTCGGPVFVELEDVAMGYIVVNSVARKVVNNEYVYSNTTMCIVDGPDLVYLPQLQAGH